MKNPRHAAVLILGSGPWKKWREANPGIRPDLASAVLSGVNLQDAALASADLHGADLSGVDLRHADLKGALLAEAALGGAILDEADLSNAFITGAFLSGATLRNATLRNANLSGADLSGVDLRGAMLRSSLFDDPDRPAAGAVKVTSLSFANLCGSLLMNCDLRGVDLSGAKLAGADLSGALLAKANLSGADLNGARLPGVNLSGANLYEAKLSGADLSGADLGGADFSGAKLIGTKMCGCSLRAAALPHADCTRADFSDAVLNGADLGAAKLDWCTVAGISCTDVKFNEATIQQNLHLCRSNEPALMIDNIETAQLVQLLITRKKARNAVLRSVSGRLAFVFGTLAGNSELLDAVTAELQKKNYSVIAADTERIIDRKYRESLLQTIELSAFAIGDLSSPAPFPAEALSVFYNSKLPLLPLLPEGHNGRAALEAFGGEVSWLQPVYFKDVAWVREKFEREILFPAEQKGKQLSEILSCLEYLM